MNKFNFMENILKKNFVFGHSEKIKNREIKSKKYKCSKIIIPSNFMFSKVKEIFFFGFSLD